MEKAAPRFQKKNIIGACAFFIALVLLLSGLSAISNQTYSEQGFRGERYSHYRSLEKDTVDVLLFGASGIWMGVPPAVLWREYGISCFNLCAPGLSPLLSYYSLLEALKTQTPKLVVINSSTLISASALGKDEQEPQRRKYLDGMPMSLTKLRALIDIASKSKDETVLSYLFPIFRFHTQWTTLYQPGSNKAYTTYDFGAETNRTIERGVQMMSVPHSDATSDYSESPGEYFHKIVDECRRRGIEVMLMATPSPNMDALRHEAALRFAQEEGIHFLSYGWEDTLQSLHLDDNADYYDDQHLNSTGAYKLTMAMGAYIQETYGLADHRGEGGAYDEWNALAQDYYLANHPEYLPLTGGETEIQTFENTQGKANNRNYYITLVKGAQAGQVFHVQASGVALSGCDQMDLSLYDFAGEATVATMTVNIQPGGTLDAYIGVPESYENTDNIRLILYYGRRSKTTGNTLTAEKITVSECVY